MAPTKWGIAAAGRIAHDFVNALSLSEDHEVVAVAARALDRAQNFADEFKIPVAYGSYEELAKASNIDVVYVATIHPFHLEVSKLMMEAGKNVLCEKPLAMNVKQGKVMAEIAKKHDVFLMEGYWSRFFPAYQDLQYELGRNTIGDIKFVSVSFGYPMVRIAAVQALAGYTVQIMLKIIGELPRKIQASAVFKEGMDVTGTATLHFSKNIMAQLSWSSDIPLDDTATIYGTKGSLKMPIMWSPEQLMTPHKTYNHPLPPAPSRRMNVMRAQGLIYEADAVRNSLLKGEKENPLMPLDDSLNILAITDEIRKEAGVTLEEDKM